MLRLIKRTTSSRRGLTLPELIVAMSVMALLAFVISMIYFSVLKIHREHAWRLPPYDEATRAVDRLCNELRQAMLIETHAADWIVVVVPEKDANRDNILTLTAEGYVLSQGDHVAFYLSDDTGTIGAEGNCLWKAVQPQGATGFTPSVKVAENIHPELNPTDPNTGLPRDMFTYWPDETRLWGVEVWCTSTATVGQETRTQTAHSEAYLRNL